MRHMYHFSVNINDVNDDKLFAQRKENVCVCKSESFDICMYIIIITSVIKKNNKKDNF